MFVLVTITMTKHHSSARWSTSTSGTGNACLCLCEVDHDGGVDVAEKVVELGGGAGVHQLLELQANHSWKSVSYTHLTLPTIYSV